MRGVDTITVKCYCGTPDHFVEFTRLDWETENEHGKWSEPEFYVEAMIPYRSLRHRIAIALRFIFNKSCNCTMTAVEIDPDDASALAKMLADFHADSLKSQRGSLMKK